MKYKLNRESISNLQKEIKMYLSKHSKLKFHTDKIEFKKSNNPYNNYDGAMFSFRCKIRPVHFLSDEVKIVNEYNKKNLLHFEKKLKRNDSIFLYLDYLTTSENLVYHDEFVILFYIDRYNVDTIKDKIFKSIENMLKDINLYK